MGLDIALGVLVLIWALRGWLKGFLEQAFQIGGIVGGVYLASPLRDLALPKVQPHLPSIDPLVLQKLVWWVAAALSYVVIVGIASLMLKVARRRPAGLEPEPSYANQSVGLLLGLAKAGVATAFLLSAVDQYALGYLKGAAWVDEYVVNSRALGWAREHRAAEQIWKCKPVQIFVAEVRREGVQMSAPKTPEKAPEPSILSSHDKDDRRALSVPRAKNRDSSDPPLPSSSSNPISRPRSRSIAKS